MKGNLARMESYIQEAKKTHADIIVFPEDGIFASPNPDWMVINNSFRIRTCIYFKCIYIYIQRDTIYPFLEEIPAPGSNPCQNSEESQYLIIIIYILAYFFFFHEPDFLSAKFISFL